MRQGRGSEGVWERGHTLELLAACRPGCLPNRIPKWRTLGPASEAQLVDAGVPEGHGRESITQPCSGRVEQWNKQKRAGIWSFGLALPPQPPHQTFLPLPPPHVPSPRSLSAYCPLGWIAPHPSSLTPSLPIFQCAAQGASSPKEAPNQSSYFRLPRHLSVTQE